MADQEKSTTEMLKELMEKMSSLEKQVQEGASCKGGQKRPRDSEGEDSAMPGSSRDGVDDQESEKSDLDSDDEPGTTEGDGLSFRLSEEGEAFMEATFGSKLEYSTRKAKVAKYGTPDSVWLKCPELSPVVAATLSKEAVKEDKAAFRAQQMWIEAAIPLATCLEKAHEGDLSATEAVPMIQAALMLMGDASQHQSSLRRKMLMQHFNPQLKGLMNDSDFGKAQPFLFGENFGEKAKARLEAAAAIKKVAYQSNKGSSKQGFRGSYPRRSNWGRGGGRQSNYGPGKSRKHPSTAPSGGRPPVDKSAR